MIYYVLLDNGHGIDTLGKRSPDGKLLEYKYTRELTSAIYYRLVDEPNIKPIIITPEEKDISLAERVKRINNYCLYHKCCMISVHLNALGDGSSWNNATGWEAYTTRKKNRSDLFAECLYDAATSVLKGIQIRTDTTDGDRDKEADFYIIKNANCPAVLTENLFMTNKIDYLYLNSPEGFNNLVALHVEGIKRFITL